MGRNKCELHKQLFFHRTPSLELARRPPAQFYVHALQAKPTLSVSIATIVVAGRLPMLVVRVTIAVAAVAVAAPPSPPSLPLLTAAHVCVCACTGPRGW